ncbi:MAG: ComEA family DNA-binding protein [Synechococcaceae cyanobacterium RL_1_2]|nr:ComEA family DNA-binding protein [Synechococcaceae cyanobacterium RL_1_2]
MVFFGKQQLKQAIAKDPYYRFQTLEEIKFAVELGITIDVNRASVDDWLRLPGLSIHQARQLKALSDRGLQFLCLEDLASALDLPLQRLAPLGAILSFCYYPATSTVTPRKINANLANLDDLTTIPTIDPHFAQAIVIEREHQGKFNNLLDFQTRLNLGSDRVYQLMAYLSFGS